MKIEVLNAHTLEKIVTAECNDFYVWRGACSWRLVCYYYDEDIDEEQRDETDLCEATTREATDDLIIIKHSAGHIEIIASEESQQLLSRVICNQITGSLKALRAKTKINSLYGLAARQMCEEGEAV